MTASVAPGEQRTVQLPDGSVVELNSETSIRFARRTVPLPLRAFQTRRVSLDGEAYFRVRASTDPFIVRTDEAHIEVLGTEFNVRARRGLAEDGTVVSLATGRVRLTSRVGSAQSVTLSENGASARISPTAGATLTEPRLAVPLDHVLAWRQSGFAVVDRPLQAVLDEVERRFAIEIAPRNGVDLTDPMSAFYLRGAAPDQILRDICLVQMCTYRETSRGFALSARDTTVSEPSDGGSSERASSDLPSSERASSDLPSSEPASSDLPSSKPASSNLPSSEPASHTE